MPWYAWVLIVLAALYGWAVLAAASREPKKPGE